MRVKQCEYGAATECKGDGNRKSLRNPARHDATPTGNRTRFALVLHASHQGEPLVCGFSRGTPVSPALPYHRCSILGSHFASCSGMTGTYGSRVESPSLGECCLALGPPPHECSNEPERRTPTRHNSQTRTANRRMGTAYIRETSHYVIPLLITNITFSFKRGASVVERLARSPLTKAIRVQSPAWESCRTMPLVSGFSRGSHVSPTLSFWSCSIFTSITFIGSRDLDVKEPSLVGEASRTGIVPNWLLHAAKVSLLAGLVLVGELRPKMLLASDVCSLPYAAEVGRYKRLLQLCIRECSVALGLGCMAKSIHVVTPYPIRLASEN
ncbi:hypothetical protein PR048_019195 [Dryococelus australis]|uniref:Uncharacterized protein n=1 Tax=Dryococelus australis TaxID=614101 RepID=A0ABQ9H2U7_9NEOP|nr:hypothetical protein PR048_019195 [Dryococelus australis]